MDFNWAEYLVLAEQLHKEGIISPADEAKIRTALSRAYYAAFKTAERYLQSHGGVKRQENEGSHEAVIRIYEDSADRSKRRIGVLLG